MPQRMTYKGLYLKSLSGESCSPDGYTHFGPINYCYYEIPYLEIIFFKLINMSSNTDSNSHAAMRNNLKDRYLKS